VVPRVPGGQSAREEKVVGLEVLYNFGLYKFFPPRAVTMGCYNGLIKTYFNPNFQMHKISRKNLPPRSLGVRIGMK